MEVSKNGVTQVSATVRIEPGPRRLKAIATKALLDDKVTHPGYREGGRDAAGKTIVLGQEMVYLDIYSAPGYYVYKEIEMEEPQRDGTPGKVKRYKIIDCCDTPEAALAAALKLGGN